MYLEELLRYEYSDDFQESTAKSMKDLASEFIYKSISIQTGSYITEAQRNFYFFDNIKKFNERFKQYNRRYRQYFLNLDPDNKQHSSFIFTYNKHKISDLVENKNALVESPENQFPKYKYTYTFFIELYKVEIAMIYAKYHHIYQFQASIAFCKILTLYFEPFDVDWKNTLLLFKNLSVDFDLQIQPIVNKLTQNIQPRTRQCYMYDSKSKRVDLDEIEKYLKTGMKITEVKEMLAAQYNCSPATIQRVMRNAGLTRKYTKK